MTANSRDKTNPSETEFDRVAQHYDAELNRGLSLTGADKEFYAQGRIDWVERRLGWGSKRPLRILDFGCGTGSLLPALRRVYPAAGYVGYDPSEQSLAVARKRAEDDPNATFTTLPDRLPAGEVDLAFTNGVFHHIEPAERAAALRVVHRVLKPGGYFAFWENNRWNPMVHLIMSRVSFDRDAQMLFPHQARRMLRRAGFEVVSTDYLFVFPQLLAVLRCIEPVLAKLPLGGQYLVLARKPARPGQGT